VTTPRPLDPDVAKVITSKKRFRAGLAEHLGFWVRLADATNGPTVPFGMARPNLQPEDKGHDGLYLRADANPLLELQSVKNSLNNPRALIATGKFRRLGVAARGAQLDDFWLLQHQNVGLYRLQDRITEACNCVGLQANAAMRTGLIVSCSYNAVVLADARYADVALFSGYKHVAKHPHQRVATYVGSKSWVSTAEAVRSVTRAILRANRV
jgi:hypothetical protein